MGDQSSIARHDAASLRGAKPDAGSPMYQYRTPPFQHQRKHFELTRDLPVYGVFWEQGTGKTKFLLDTAAWLYERGRINGVLIISDNGVHHTWIAEQLPEHFPWDRLPTLSYVWGAHSLGSKRHAAAVDALLAFPGLSFLAMNIESIITPRGSGTIQRFLTQRRVLFIQDESVNIKTPKAKRTRTSIQLGKLAPYRRIATGQPMAESPLDLYAQFAFLDRSIIGAPSFLVFKHEYAEWIPIELHGKRFEKLRTDDNDEPVYKNLDQLRAKIDPYCSFVFKKDCLDLPPKVYQTRHFELSLEIRRVYDQLRDEYLLELSQQELIPIALVITRHLKLAQVASGLYPLDIPATEEDEDTASRMDWDNARLTTLLDVVGKLPKKSKAIIWCRFRFDCTNIVEALEAVYGYGAVVRYDGSVKAKDREWGKKEFQTGKARFFVGTARAGGRGLTLTAASFVIFYSHDLSLERRLQAEDRAHRIGQVNKVTYINLVALRTVDESTIARYKGKRKRVTMISREQLGEWL